MDKEGETDSDGDKEIEIAFDADQNSGTDLEEDIMMDYDSGLGNEHFDADTSPEVESGEDALSNIDHTENDTDVQLAEVRYAKGAQDCERCRELEVQLQIAKSTTLTKVLPSCLSSRTITVFCGSSYFYIHRTPACLASEIFQNFCTREPFDESDILHIEGHHGVALLNFIKYIMSGDYVLEDFQQECDWYNHVKAYILGHFLLAISFKNRAMEKLKISLTRAPKVVDRTMVDLLASAYYWDEPTAAECQVSNGSEEKDKISMDLTKNLEDPNHVSATRLKQMVVAFAAPHLEELLHLSSFEELFFGSPEILRELQDYSRIQPNVVLDPSMNKSQDASSESTSEGEYGPIDEVVV